MHSRGTGEQVVGRRWWVLVAVAVVALALGGCSDDGDDAAGGDGADGSAALDGGAGTTQAPMSPEVTILVTNDDGVGAPGIDALVQALTELDEVEVVVVAPAENQSGTSDTTSEGEVTWADATTASGYPAVAVAGTPADSVNVALGDLGIEPDLVVSGINEGQNIGPLSELSGTVGAARTAARQGVPALAVSQGLAQPDEPDYPGGVEAAVLWVTDNRDAAVAGELDTTTIVSINVPTCAPGTERQGSAEVPTAADAEGRNLLEVDCEADVSEPTDDVDGFIHGWTVVAEVSLG